MNEAIGECPQNPHGKGHCDHTEMHKTTAGTSLIAKCCWCGRTEQTFMSLPDHGTHAPPYLRGHF